MPTVINTNLASLFAQNSLSNAQNNLAQSVQRLSSGLRINSAKDDAAGLSISQNMQSQINGTNQSVRNLSDATNLLQVADSSLSTVQDMLLRLKQLATQGYDGSLSTSQKLNIVQEMKELNTEINTTAQRTTFNGINLLTSGASVDLNNSDVKSGEKIITTATTYATSAGTLGERVVLSNTNGGVRTAGTTGATAALQLASAGVTGGSLLTGIEIDPALAPKLGGLTFTFTARGNNLTMTGTQDGLAKSQTVAIRDTVFDSLTAITDTQSINFDQFGVKFNISTLTVANVATTGASIASAFADPTLAGDLVFNGVNGEISNLSTTGVAPGTYQMSSVQTGAAATALTVSATNMIGTSAINAVTFTSNGNGSGATINVTPSNATTATAAISGGSGYKVGDLIYIRDARLSPDLITFRVDTIGGTIVQNLQLAGTVNGVATSQMVAVSANAANATQKINFDTFGVSMDVKSYQAQTAAQITDGIARLANGTPAQQGQLVIAQGNNSALKFQSSANSDAFIQINTRNVQTGTTGATAGSSTEMMTLGTRISQTGAGNLGTLGALDTIDTWQTAFRNAAAAVDAALEYISTERAVYGSQMNRLSYVSTNLQTQSTNLQNSRSSIIDTDFAAETARLTKGQIMQQAATAMLAQANQMPNVILSLLK